jgi:hypothetical protein
MNRQNMKKGPGLPPQALQNPSPLQTERKLSYEF